LGELDLILLLAASLALTVVPGADNILVLNRVVGQGRGAALVPGAGASLGLVAHSVFAAVGFSALLAQPAVAFSVVKYAAAAYLAYSVVRTFVDREYPAASSGVAPVSLKSAFVQGWASNVTNPKGALFFLAFLPQVAEPASPGGAALQPLTTIGLPFVLLTWAVFSVLEYFSGGSGNWLGGRPGYANALPWLTGSVLVGLRLRLAFSDRR
jgi:threonine/homoserine/homoserine lactone efflux protein